MALLEFRKQPSDVFSAVRDSYGNYLKLQELLTLHSVMRIVEIAHNGFEVGAKTAILALDIEKAFDKLWRKGIIAKLIGFDAPDWLIMIINNFLSNRKFQVKINDTLSDYKDTYAGVAQGSVLGPTLFNIFMANFHIPKPGKLALFADDAAIILQSIRKHEIVRVMNKNIIPEVESWYSRWRLKINIDKTQAILISRGGTKPPNQEIQLHGHSIPWKNTMKYLGVTLDPRLSFRTHVDNNIKTAKANLVKLYPLVGRRSKLSPSNKISILTRIFLPAILYASVVWANATKTTIHKIQVFQNKFLRMALNIPYCVSNRDIAAQFGIESVHDRILRMANNYYERLDDHSNPLIQGTVNYPIRKIRKVRDLGTFWF